MSDTPTNDNSTADLRHAIAALADGVSNARGEVAEGKAIDLSLFLSKVSTVCASITSNPPSGADAPMIMNSIEKLVSDLNELGRELTELETLRANSEPGTGGDEI
ncbi:MAG: hypothetical protein HQ494_14815 [Rhodospirillales bacterium]|nr:hypothetical protein [Rhodospirillales bacterium]